MRALALLVDTVRLAVRRDLLGEGAKVAFFFLLALFPFLLVLFALTGLIGGPSTFDALVEALRRTLPPAAVGYVEAFLEEGAAEERPGVLSVGVLFTVWAASTAAFRLSEGLNAMRGLSYAEYRGRWLLRRLRATAVLLAGSVVLVAGTALILGGTGLFAVLGLPNVWMLLRAPLAFLLIALVLAVQYVLLPRPPRVRWGPALAGGAAAAALWVAATVGFRAYAARVLALETTVEAVGGILSLLLWLWLSAVAVLLGGQLTAVLDAALRARRAPTPIPESV